MTALNCKLKYPYFLEAVNFVGFSEASLNVLERANLKKKKKNIDFIPRNELLVSILKGNYWLIGWEQENLQEKKRKEKERKTSDVSEGLQILLSSHLCLYTKTFVDWSNSFIFNGIY